MENITRTHKEKYLLIKDLCCRLPYKVKIQYENDIFTIDYIAARYEEIKPDAPNNYTIGVSEVKLYLFPLSSMTEEQKQEYQHITERWMSDSSYSISDSIDWLNVHHFDYRGLIEKGLAIDATGLNIY